MSKVGPFKKKLTFHFSTSNKKMQDSTQKSIYEQIKETINEKILPKIMPKDEKKHKN